MTSIYGIKSSVSLSTKPKAHLSVGDEAVAALVQTVLPEETGVVVRYKSRGTAWHRDPQVIRPSDGAHLVPKISLTFRRAADLSGSARLLRYRFPTRQSIETVTEKCPVGSSLGQQVNKITSYIEGGNIKFFRHLGRAGAIIGMSSVIHTAHSMEVLGLLPESSDIDAIYERVLVQIAEDLQIDKECLLVLKHSLFHIDLMVLMGPDGKVFLHSPSKAWKALEYAEERLSDTLRQDLEDRDFFMKEKSYIKRELQSGIYEYNKKVLQDFGFEVIEIGGIYSFTNSGGQFLNGLLFSDPRSKQHCLLTNALCAGFSRVPSEPPESLGSIGLHSLAEPFYDCLREHNIQVVFVNSQGYPEGGLHCMTMEERETWEGSLQTIPFDSAYLSQSIPTFLFVRTKLSDDSPIDLITQIDADEEPPLLDRIQLVFDQMRKTAAVTLQVPLSRRQMTFRLQVERLVSPPNRILPGHPIQIDLHPRDMCTWSE